MIMEPMSEDTANLKEQMDRSKFRSGLRRSAAAVTGKRKRSDEEEIAQDHDSGKPNLVADRDINPKKVKTRGSKGPNPLSVKRPKKTITALDKPENMPQGTVKVPLHPTHLGRSVNDAQDTTTLKADGRQNNLSKRKRRRKGRGMEEKDDDDLATADSGQQELRE